MYSVLYVDDEPNLLTIGKLFLERSGEFTVETKESAQEGLAVFGSRHFDAIISDYQMPEKDGIQFLKEVRSGYGDVPFILFTGRGREEVVIEAINSGADFYIRKVGTRNRSLPNWPIRSNRQSGKNMRRLRFGHPNG